MKYMHHKWLKFLKIRNTDISDYVLVYTCVYAPAPVNISSFHTCLFHATSDPTLCSEPHDTQDKQHITHDGATRDALILSHHHVAKQYNNAAHSNLCPTSYTANR